MHSVEFPLTLSMSDVNPTDVETVVAGWARIRSGHSASGYVIRLRSTGTYAYVVSERSPSRRRVLSERHDTEPTHLYVRGLPWTFGEELDAQISKVFGQTYAKYPTDGQGSILASGGMVRSRTG